MKPIYTTLPVQLIKYAIMDRKVNQLSLYVYLKVNSSGHVTYNNDYYKIWAVDLNRSERWVRDSLKWLKKEGWVTVNSKRKSLRIISYKQLEKKLGLNFKYSVIFEKEDFSYFRKFCAAAIVSNLIKVIKHKVKRRSGSIMGKQGSSMNRTYPKGFYPLPVSTIANHLHCSNSSANKLKKEAIEIGFISVKRNIVDFTPQIPVECFNTLRETYPEYAGRLRKGKKFIKFVEADLINSDLIIKRKRLKY